MQNIRYYRNDMQLGVDLFEIGKELKSGLSRISRRRPGSRAEKLDKELLKKCDKVRCRLEWSRRRGEKLLFLKRLKRQSIMSEEILLFCLLQNQTNRGMGNRIERYGSLFDNIYELFDGDSVKICKMVDLLNSSSIMSNPRIVSYNKEGVYKLSRELMGILLGVEPSVKIKEASKKIKSAKEILKKLNSRVIGQERAKQVLATASFGFMKSINKDESSGFPNILLMGPTGSGKTHLMQSLSEILDLPFVQIRASSFSKTGYVGSSVAEIIGKLKKEMRKKENKKGGIIYIDEIDKVAVNDTHGTDVGGRAVQEELLNIMDKSKFSDKIYLGGAMGYEKVSIDTSKVLFVCGGAFAELEDEKTNLMGFASDGEEISPGTLNQDLIDFGMLPELLGRLPVKIRLEDHSVDAIVDIILNPNVSPVNEFINFVPGLDSILDIPGEDIDKIAIRAKEYGVGARGIYSALEEYFAPVLYGGEKTL